MSEKSCWMVDEEKGDLIKRTIIKIPALFIYFAYKRKVLKRKHNI